jgi:predicted O-methyltransferase YrrM
VKNPLRIGRKLYRAALGRAPRARYEARFSLLNELAREWGFALYTFNLAWLEDAEFLEAWHAFPARDVPTHDRKFVLYSLARSVAMLAGDTAECGVLAGASSHLMCTAMAQPGRVHHVFDSFAGLSEPSAEDVPRSDHTFRWQKHDLALPLEAVQRNLARFPAIEYHAGWIPARFADVADARFAFVHVDVDLYQPTLDSLEFFYPRLVPGGILLCDDYGSTACPGARRAFDEMIADRPEKRVVHLPTGQGLIIKRER